MNLQNSCGVETTLKIIGKKWTIILLHQLCGGTKRFGELERSMPGISPRTLSARLDDLEKFGVVKKRIFKEVPLHVEYSLSEKGKSLKSIIESMRIWGENDIIPNSADRMIAP